MKKILTIAVAIAAICACSKVESNVETAPKGQTITLKAGINNDFTKAVYGEDPVEGITAEFEADDQIYVFDASGNMTVFTVESVDGSGVATFAGTPETPIGEGDPITAVVKNAGTSVSSSTVTVNLNNQAGTLDSAGEHELMYASGTYSASGVSLMFEHKTSIVKFVVSLPEAETATSINNFYLFTVDNRATVEDQGGDQFTYFNKVSVNALTGVVTEGKGTEKGWISWTTATAVSDHKATIYLSVPAVNLRNAALQCTPNSDAQKRYFWNIAGSSELTIEAGKAYTITRTQTQFAPSAAGKTFFYNDDAQVYNFGLPQGSIVTYSTSTGDWLTKETDGSGNMQIRMAANTTGSPREATLTFKVFGAFCKYSVTQLEPKDFDGDWTLTMASGYHREVETGDGAYAAAAAASGTGVYGSTGAKAKGYYYDDTWAPSSTNIPSTSLSVTHSEDGSGFIGNSYTNFTDAKTAGINKNLLITGLYRNLTMAGRVEVDYTNNRARYYLYFNTTPQVISGGPYDGQYGAIVTELVQSANTSNYCLGIAHGGNGYLYGADANSASYGSNISVSGGTTTVNIPELQYCPAYTSYKVKGLMVTRLATSTNAGANLIRSTKSVWAKGNEAQSGAAYAAIYQGSIRLTKTAAIATPAPIVAPIVDNTNW